MPNYVQALEVGADLAKSLGVDFSHCAAELWRPATRTAESVFSETELAKMAEGAANPIVITDGSTASSLKFFGEAMKRDQFDASKTIVNEFAIRSGM